MKRPRGVGFLEVMPEHLVEGTPESRQRILAAAKLYPTVTHSVTLSVGTATGADLAFARKMKAVNAKLRAARAGPASRAHAAGSADGVEATNPTLGAAWSSDHLCYTKVGDKHIGQLTPFPYTKEALTTVVRNVKALQRELASPFLLENISAYFAFDGADYDEPEFVSEVVKRTGCGVLLDVTNLHNNATNLGLDPGRYLDRYPLDAVVQLHLAGSEWVDGKLLDTHGGPVLEPVWDLTQRVCEQADVRAALIERDQTFELGDLVGETRRAGAILEKARRA
jgi:uncharacterized protein